MLNLSLEVKLNIVPMKLILILSKHSNIFAKFPKMGLKQRPPEIVVLV